MASEQFPMFKLATLLARQMSSPIATRVKTYAKSHPQFGTQVCVRVAEAYRGGEWAARAWALRLAGTALRHRRPPLPRQQAVDLGADLIGEIVIFTLGSLIIIFEVNRQAAIKEGKALHIKSEWLAVKLCLEELQTEVALQQQEIDSLHRTLLLLTNPATSPPSGPPHERPAMHAPDPPFMPSATPPLPRPSPLRPPLTPYTQRSTQPPNPSGLSHVHDVPLYPNQALPTLQTPDGQHTSPPPLAPVPPPPLYPPVPALAPLAAPPSPELLQPPGLEHSHAPAAATDDSSPNAKTD